MRWGVGLKESTASKLNLRVQKRKKKRLQEVCCWWHCCYGLALLTAKQNHLTLHFCRKGRIPSFRFVWFCFFRVVMVVLDWCAAGSAQSRLPLLSQGSVNVVVLARTSLPQLFPLLMWCKNPFLGCVGERSGCVFALEQLVRWHPTSPRDSKNIKALHEYLSALNEMAEGNEILSLK